jgi:non-homologous end joining protein Ku
MIRFMVDENPETTQKLEEAKIAFVSAFKTFKKEAVDKNMADTIALLVEKKDVTEWRRFKDEYERMGRPDLIKLVMQKAESVGVARVVLEI